MALGRLTQPRAEGGEIVAFEGHRGDRIAHLGVESSRHEDEIGAEGDDGVE